MHSGRPDRIHPGLQDDARPNVPGEYDDGWLPEMGQDAFHHCCETVGGLEIHVSGIVTLAEIDDVAEIDMCEN